MRKVQGIAIVVAFLAGLLGTGPSAASATTFAGAHFTCEMTIPSFGGFGYTTTCTGSVTGAGITGAQAYACGVDQCDLRIEFDGSENCAAMPDSPPLGFYSVDIYVNGGLVASGSANRFGTALTFFPTQELNGGAAWIPLELPLPTCENPGPLTVRLEGTFFSGS